MSEKRLSVVPPEVTPDDLEDYLATDDLFIDYFNAFLQLSTFSKPVYFNKENGGFEVVSDEKQSLKQRLRDLVRSQQKPNPIYKAAIAMATAKKPPKMPWHYAEEMEEPDIKTSFKVQCLNKEQGIQWIKAERLPTFLQSDCYIEYRLAKLISQTEIADKASDTPLNLFIDPKYEPFAIERPPVIEPPEVDEQAIAMRDLFVCMGEASTTQTQDWFSTVKMSATTSTTNSVGNRPSSAVTGTGASRPGSAVTWIGTSRPDSVALTLDSGFVSPSRSDGLNMSLSSQDLGMEMVADLPNRETLFEKPLKLREWRAPIGDNVCVVAEAEKKGRGGAFYLDINKPETVEEEEDDKASIESNESGCDSGPLDETESVDLTQVETKAESKIEEKEVVVSSPSPKIIKIKNLNDIANVVVSVSLEKALLVTTETSKEDIDKFLDDNVLKVEGVQMGDLTEKWEDQLEYEPPSSPLPHKNITLQVPYEVERSISRLSTSLSECKDTVGDADSLFDSDQEEEEDSQETFFSKPKQTYDLMNKKGIDAFRKFLWGSEGEKCWNLWLDIDRGTMIDDQEVCKAFLSQLRDKYMKTGGECELSSAMKDRLGLKAPSQWTSMEQLAQLKTGIIKPLLLYWAPRFLMRETYQRNQPSNYLYIRQQLLTKPHSVPYPDPPTVTLLPLRPKTCWPRLRSYSADSEPTQVHVNQHMKKPPQSCSVSRPSSASTLQGSVKKPDTRHERSHTLPIIPLTSAMTTITPKQAVPLGRASVGSTPVKNKVEAITYGSQAGPGVISRVKPVPPKSAPPSAIKTRRKRPDIEQTVKDEVKEQAIDEEEEDEEEEDDMKSDASEFEGDRGSQSTGSVSQHSPPSQREEGSRPCSASITEITETEFFGGAEMEGLLKDLYQEKRTGGFIKNFLEKREDEVALNCLGCWHELQEYHALFYSDVFKPYEVARKAKTIQSKYVVERCFFDVDCPAMIRYQVFRQINPPYEDLYDGLEEHLLATLLIPWLDMKDSDRSLSNKIELMEEERQLDNIKSKHLQKLQRRLMRERIATPDFTMEGEDEETKREVYYETLAEKVPAEFKDYDFDKLIRNRMEVEHFRKFLEENYALMDLMCWLDIESFRRTPHLDTKKRDAKAMDIKTKYLNKKYFFGPNSPATRMQQHEVMMAGGGWGKLLLDRPPNQIMLEAQKYVRERLARKWLPLFIMTETFQERQRPHIRLEDVVDDVMANKRKRYMAIYKLLESRFVSSSHEIIALRQALMNPITCQHFRKFVSLKGDNLENDVLFWLEVQKFKEMYHIHSEESLIHQKIQAILRCFINSEMGPSLQIDITPEQAEKILDKRMREMGPYVFRDAQLTVFRVLSSHWKDFQKYRTSLSEEKMMEELDRKRKKMKKKEMEKARIEDEKEFAKQNAPKEDEHLSSGVGSSLSMRRMSTRLSGIIPGFLEEEEEEEEEKVQWKYSDYMEGLEREKQLLNGDDRASSLMSTIESLAEDQDSARSEKATKNSLNESEKHGKGKPKSKLKDGKGRRSPASSIKDQPLSNNQAGQGDAPPKSTGTKKRVTLIEPVRTTNKSKYAGGHNGDVGSKVRGQGRFSNQAEQLLGSLFFAKTLDRVLVIPPFIDYQHAVGQRKDNLYVPVTEYFDLNALREYYPDIVTFEDFMYELSPTHWPVSERVAYCSSRAAEGNNDMCPRKGNPFSTFWEAQNVEFTRSEIWSGDLHYNVEYEPWRVVWTETFAPSDHPVLAFMNAPTSTPLPQEKNYLHKYLQWSKDIENEGDKYISENIQRPYVGLHLRNGADWARTCDLADGSMQRLLSSQQCLGVHPTTTVHRQLCMQSEELVSEEVRALMEEKEVKTIFVATDHVSMQDDLQRDFPELNVVTMDPERPQLDMYVLGEADHFIGNCISAFTAFVRRHRDEANLETHYFGMRQTHQKTVHDEF